MTRCTVFDEMDIGNAGMVMSGERSRAGSVTSGEQLPGNSIGIGDRLSVWIAVGGGAGVEDSVDERATEWLESGHDGVGVNMSVT